MSSSALLPRKSRNLSPTRLSDGHPKSTIDIVHDKLSNGRSYKMLTVLDEHTREELCVAVRSRMTAGDVLDALYPLLMKHRKSEYIRSDNGPEFSLRLCRNGSSKLGSSYYTSPPAHHGRTDSTSGSTARCAAKCSMRSGSIPSGKLSQRSMSGCAIQHHPASSRPLNAVASPGKVLSV